MTDPRKVLRQAKAEEQAAETLLKLWEAARRLGVSTITVKRYVKRGDLAYRRLPSGHIRIIESSLEQCATRHDRRLQ